MKKYKILSLLLVIMLFVGALPVSAGALTDPSVSAKAAVLMNVDTGEVLFEKNADQSMDPASTTAIMTALLVAEAVDDQRIGLEDLVIASDDVLSGLGGEDASTLDPAIQPGEDLTVNELLHCILLRSASDACNALAAYVSDSVSAFVSEMNQRAEELGCTNTSFQNANGEPASNHKSTARDIALIAQAAASNPTIVNICDNASYTVSETNASGARELTNSNQLVVPDSDHYYGEAYGLKAGYADGEGYCLAAAAQSSDINVVAVVLGCEKGGSRYTDAINLLEWMFDNYSYKTIMSDTETLENVPVALGTADATGVRPDGGVEVLMPNDQELGDVRFEVTYYHEQNGTVLTAPISAGETLGEVTVYVDGVARGTSRLVATSEVDMSRLEYLRSQAEDMLQTPEVRRIIKILVILLAVYVLLVLFYWLQRVRHLVSLRRARKDRAIARARQETEWLEIPEDDDNDPNIDFFPEEEPSSVGPDYDSPRARRTALRGAQRRRGRQQEPRQESYDDGDNDDYEEEYAGRHDGGRRTSDENSGSGHRINWTDEDFDEFFRS